MAGRAQQIVVHGANVDPSTLKPYFTGTDPASVERGVEDLKATGIYSNVSATVENGKVSAYRARVSLSFKYEA